MEEKEVKTKEKGVKMIFLIILGVLLVSFLGMQVFATVNGYENIFFILKKVVSKEAHGENEIFYDKEITLSNKYFNVTDNVKMQINKLQLKEEESILCITVKANEDNVLPFTYSIKSEGLSKTDIESSEMKTIGEFQDTLSVKYKFAEDELITLYIKDKDGNLLKEVEINLYTREIIVTDNGNVDKISQTELNNNEEDLKNNTTVSKKENNTIVNKTENNTIVGNKENNTMVSKTENKKSESEQLDYNLDIHDHIFNVVLNSGDKASDGVHTTLNGTHIEKCSICGEERRVKHNFGKWFTIDNGSGKAYTLWCNDCKDYVYTTDYDFVKKSGYGMVEEDTSIETNNIKEKETSVVIMNSMFKVGEDYTITYTNPEKKYKTDIVKCTENGKVYSTFVGGNGNYVIGIITKNNDTESINLEKKVCVINNGIVEKKEYTDIKVSVNNSQLKSGHEYDVCYTTPDGKYKNKKTVSSEDGKVQILINGTSGKYIVGMIVDENNNSIQSNGYYFEVDDFGNSK